MSNETYRPDNYQGQNILTNNFWQTTRKAGKIDKATGYIIVPSSGYLQFTSYGAPFAVTSYIYNCPNNICIPRFPYSPILGSNFNLAIRYNNPTNNIPVRYKLWDFANDDTDIPAPLYAQQPILGGNFAIEVWSQGGQPSLNMLANLFINTSVRGVKQLLNTPDYFQLGSYYLCSGLGSTNGLNVPLTFSTCATATGSGGTTPVPPIVPPGPPTPSIPTQGVNYRFLNGVFQILNIQTGEWNALNTEGLINAESIIVDPQTP